MSSAHRLGPGRPLCLLCGERLFFSFYHEPSYGVSAIAFGPDGYLYLGTSVYSEDGRDTATVARKVLRIDVDHPGGGKMYSIPAYNPFAKSADPDVRKEIYALGLRNVWSMSFDFQTGKLWAGDVGQDLFEEIVLIMPGKNYGWADWGGIPNLPRTSMACRAIAPRDSRQKGLPALGRPIRIGSFRIPPPRPSIAS